MFFTCHFAIKSIGGEYRKKNLRRKNKISVILTTGRFDNIDLAVITSTVYARQYKTEKQLQFCTALLSLLMMTAESMLSQRPVVRITEILFFHLKLQYFRPIFIVFRKKQLLGLGIKNKKI